MSITLADVQVFLSALRDNPAAALANTPKWTLAGMEQAVDDARDAVKAVAKKLDVSRVAAPEEGDCAELHAALVVHLGVTPDEAQLAVLRQAKADFLRALPQGVRVRLTIQNTSKLTLESIRVDTPRQGLGAQAMAALVALVDANQLLLTALVQTSDVQQDGPDVPTLLQWFARFGLHALSGTVVGGKATYFLERKPT